MARAAEQVETWERRQFEALLKEACWMKIFGSEQETAQAIVYGDVGDVLQRSNRERFLKPPDPRSLVHELVFLDPDLGPDLDRKVPLSQDEVRRLNLRLGDVVEVRGGHNLKQIFEKGSERGWKIITPPFAPDRIRYQDLVATKPYKWLPLVSEKHVGEGRITSYIIDLICPIAAGTRGTLIAPTGVGKTTLLQVIGAGLSKYSKLKVMVLTIFERPEERAIVEVDPVYSDLKSGLPGVELWHVPYTQSPEEAYTKAWMFLGRVMRLVEAGIPVFVLADSITRLTLLFNAYIEGGSKGSGGITDKALEEAQKWLGHFGAFEGDYSAGIIGTILDGTNKAETVILEQLRGTGNWHMHLSDAMHAASMYPTIARRSFTRDPHFFRGTSREEKLEWDQRWAELKSSLPGNDIKFMKDLRSLVERSVTANRCLLDMLRMETKLKQENPWEYIKQLCNDSLEYALSTGDHDLFAKTQKVLETQAMYLGEMVAGNGNAICPIPGMGKQNTGNSGKKPKDNGGKRGNKR